MQTRSVYWTQNNLYKNALEAEKCTLKVYRAGLKPIGPIAPNRAPRQSATKNVIKFIQGITKPTPVQYHCIPPIMEGKGCVAISKTGTGKTLAFVLPMLHNWCSNPVSRFALILTPTRELARQIYDQIKVIGKPINIQVCLIIGGENQVEQGAQIARGPHIIVATPGRLSDMMQSGYATDFKYIKMLVIDEADRMLSGSFTEDLEVIMGALPKKRQTLLFSATMTPMVENAITHDEIKEHPFVWKGEADVTTVTELDQKYVIVRNAVLRSGYLVKIINDYQAKTPDSSMIIFTKNCEVCQIVSEALKKLGFDNVALNSNLKQKERTTSITRFKSNRIKILVATDLASRGLDIPMVDLVVNYSVPPVPANYVHRVGRTARAGRGGLSLTLLTPKEINRLLNIERNINHKLTEYKVSEEKVLELALQVEVTFREAAVNLQYDEAVERKEVNKKKRIILNGGEIYVQSERQRKKNNKKLRNSKKSESETVSLDAVAALGGDISALRTQAYEGESDQLSNPERKNNMSEESERPRNNNKKLRKSEHETVSVDAVTALDGDVSVLQTQLHEEKGNQSSNSKRKKDETSAESERPKKKINKKRKTSAESERPKKKTNKKRKSSTIC